MLRRIPDNRKNLLIMAFCFGSFAAIAQVLLIRELLTIFRGNEFIIGIIFASWFLGIYLGARFNPPAGSEILNTRVRASLIALPVLLALCIYSGHGMPLIFTKTTGTFYSITAELSISLLITLPISGIIGFFFPPMVALLAETDGARSGGIIYAIESIGSFTGGIIFYTVLVRWCNPLMTTAILAMIACVILGRQKKIWYALLIIPLATAILSPRIENDIFNFIWTRTRTGSLIQHQRTKYQNVFVETGDEQMNIYGNGILFHSLPDRYEVRPLFHLIQSLRIKKNERVLLIGSPGSLLHNLGKTDISSLTYLESDPDLWEMMTPIRKKFYPEPVSSNRSIVLKDPRSFFLETTEYFDLVICLAPPPENIMLNRAVTRDFFSLVKRRLSDDGIFVTVIPGFSNFMAEDLKNMIASTYKGFIAEFPHHLKTSGERIYLIGARAAGILPGTAEQLIGRYRERLTIMGGYGLEPAIMQNVQADELKMLIDRSQIDYFDRTIGEKLNTIPENRDLRPQGYWNYLVFSAFEEQSILYVLIKGYMLIPIIVAGATALAFFDVRRRYGRSRFFAALSVYAIGMVSISIMILMIILYQNYNGIIYNRIALISALFMLGLTAGGFVFNRREYMSVNARFLLTAVALSLAYGYTLVPAGFLFWTAIGTLSFLCGSIFTSLFASIRDDNYHQSAGVLDALEHFGSIAGSLITTLVLLPVAGIQGTIIFNIGAIALIILVNVLKKPEA